MRAIIGFLFPLVLVFLLPCAAAAEGFHPARDHPFSMSLGAGFLYSDVKVIQWDEGRRQPPPIDLDRLGVDHRDNTFWATVDWRIGQRWLLAADYFSLNVSGGRQVDFEFEFSDLVVPAGAFVDSSLGLDFYVISAAYTFHRTDRAEFGGGLGVHGVAMDYDLYGEAFLGDTTIFEGQENDDFLAPLPNAYIYGSYALTPELVVRFESAYMSLSYDDYDGDLVSLHGQLAYWLGDRVAIGVGYGLVDLDVERDAGTELETYDIYMDGPRAFLTFTF